MDLSDYSDDAIQKEYHRRVSREDTKKLWYRYPDLKDLFVIKDKGEFRSVYGPILSCNYAVCKVEDRFLSIPDMGRDRALRKVIDIMLSQAIKAYFAVMVGKTDNYVVSDAVPNGVLMGNFVTIHEHIDKLNQLRRLEIWSQSCHDGQ